MPIISVVVMMRQEDQEFKPVLGYKASLRPVKATWDPNLQSKITIMN